MSYVGIAGDPNTSKLAAVAAATQTHGIVGIAGANCNGIISSAERATSQVGIAGNLSPAYRAGLHILAGGGDGATSLGDRAQRDAWKAGCWLVDFTYITSPYHANGKGYRLADGLRWREGRDRIFDRQHRALPLWLDSCFRRIFSDDVPKWAQSFDRYCEAVALTDPDHFAAWDTLDKAESLAYLEELRRRFPHDDRLVPIWSVRWNWTEKPPYRLADLPGWASTSLAQLVPPLDDIRMLKPSTLEAYARLAVANAVVVARDPQFQAMCSASKLVMLGGMVRGPVHRMVRGLYTAALCALYPDNDFWLLGCASAPIVNCLSWLGLLDRVSVDGTWWVLESLNHVVAFYKQGLIRTVNLGGTDSESFYTTGERMAGLLRSLLAAYTPGLMTWPKRPEVPIDFRDLAQLTELRGAYQAAQLELGLV